MSDGEVSVEERVLLLAPTARDAEAVPLPSASNPRPAMSTKFFIILFPLLPQEVRNMHELSITCDEPNVGPPRRFTVMSKPIWLEHLCRV